ncbi:MAG: hypothetical protein ACREQ5_19545, partial [Candidatus Dormibacteria bacterium]
MEHLIWAGKYVAEKRPDKIIHIGDHWDMPSLNGYDVGKKSFEGRRYTDDIAIGQYAMNLFMDPIRKAIEHGTKMHRNRWNPTFHFFLGNHEQRIHRAIDSDRKLEGLISYRDFQLEPEWKVYDYLVPVNLDGVN